MLVFALKFYSPFYTKKAKLCKQITSLSNQYIETLQSYLNTMHFRAMENNKRVCNRKEVIEF